MKTRHIFSYGRLVVMPALIAALLLWGCHGGGKSGSENGNGITGSCKVTTAGGLMNCESDKCTGTCVFQVRHKTPKTPSDTSWRDIPGGNVNPSDMEKDGQEARCICR